MEVHPLCVGLLMRTDLLQGRDRGGGGHRGGAGRASESHSHQPATSHATPAPAAHTGKDTGSHHHPQQRGAGGGGGGGGAGGGYDRDWYYGLYTFTNGNTFHPLPAKAVAIHASLNSLSVEVTVIQRYINHEKQPIDATFIFPVPFQAAVREFEAGRKHSIKYVLVVVAQHEFLV